MMSIRPFRAPNDLQTLADIIPKAFQYPENEAWSIQEDEVENLVDSMQSIRKIWWVFRTLQIFVPMLKDALRGFVWEEDGQVVGSVNVLRQGRTDQWTIGNVAVLPEYRRRGIARQLVEQSIEYAKGREAKTIILDVVAGNVPAYELYEKLGFEHYSGSQELFLEKDVHVSNITLSSAYRLERLKFSEWEPRYEIAKRLTPDEVQHYKPVEKKRYQMPFLLRPFIPLLMRLGGGKTTPFKIYCQDDLIGITALTVRRAKGGVNGLTLNLDPKHADVAPQLVQKLVADIQTQSPDRRIEFSVPQWQKYISDAAYEVGFHEHFEYHAMGMKV